MKKSGMSNEQVGRALFGGEHFIKKALGASIGEEDPVSERRMNEVVEHLRSESEGFGRQMVLPTRVGKNRPDPTYVGGAKQVSIGRFAHLTDRLDAIQTVEGAVERIHQFVEKLDPEDQQDLKRLKAKAEQELQDPDVSSAFREVSQAFGAVLRQNVDKMAGHLGEVSARYMGGEYKVAMPQTRIMPKMRELHGAADLSGTAPNQQFRDTVEKMLRNAKPHAAGTEGFDDAVESASKDLFKYIRQQDNRFGEEITEWQGMGVSEGFINRSEAQKVLDKMKERHQAGSEHPNQIVEEATNLQGSAQEDLQRIEDLKKLEIERLRQEIERPGSTSGALGMMTRQPDFQAIGGYEMGRHTALGRQAMYAMGMDPDQINTMSNPLASFSRGEDFDMDFNYRAMLEDPAIAGHMREQANHTPDQLLALHRILEQMDPNSKKVSEGPSTSFSRAGSYEEEIYIDTGKGDQRQRVKTDVRRVTTNVESGAETFDQPVGAYFGYSGSALQAQMSGPEAREAYSLQQSIVGSFGAYSKQGAIQTRQRVNAFNDIMTRMERMIAEEEEARAAASTADTGRAASADVARNATERAFRESFRTPSQVSRLRSMEGNVIQNPWEFMKQTFKDTADAQRAHPNMPFSPLHTATLAEQAITQTAIEKYKKAGALEEAKRLHNISSTLHGNHKGGYQGFDDAMDALLDEEIRGHQVTDYFKGADEEIGRNVTESELEDRARKAFRLQYNRNISMQMIEQAGIATDSYQQFGSSMSVGDTDPAEKVAAGLRQRGQFMGEGGGVQQMQAVMDFLQGDDTQRAMQSFASAENYFQSRIQSIMDRPATYREVHERSRQPPARSEGRRARGARGACRARPDGRSPNRSRRRRARLSRRAAAAGH